MKIIIAQEIQIFFIMDDTMNFYVMDDTTLLVIPYWGIRIQLQCTAKLMEEMNLTRWFFGLDDVLSYCFVV